MRDIFSSCILNASPKIDTLAENGDIYYFVLEEASDCFLHLHRISVAVHVRVSARERGLWIIRIGITDLSGTSRNMRSELTGAYDSSKTNIYSEGRRLNNSEFERCVNA